MIIAICVKAFQRVRGYRRRTGLVSGYNRNTKFPPRVKKLFEKHYPNIERWSAISVAYQKAKGVHFQSFDDAAEAGMHEALHALRRYTPKSGPIENFIRPSIKFGILKHLQWERGHGMTGTRTLYDLIHREVTDEQRQKIIDRFPEVTEVPETLPDENNSIESMMEQAYALSQRDHLLDEIEKEFNIKLKDARDELKKKEKTRTTWKNVSLAKRQLKIYKMKTVDNMSYRDIAEKLGIGVARVFDDFAIAKDAIRKLNRKPDIKKAFQGGRSNQERFLMNLARLENASKRGYPEAYQEFVLDRMAMLFSQLAQSDPENLRIAQ